MTKSHKRSPRHLSDTALILLRRAADSENRMLLPIPKSVRARSKAAGAARPLARGLPRPALHGRGSRRQLRRCAGSAIADTHHVVEEQLLLMLHFILEGLNQLPRIENGYWPQLLVEDRNVLQAPLLDY
jgi:hypothetical protein